MKTLIAILALTCVCKAAEPGFDWNSETIRCGNLVYDQNKTAICFAERFLVDAAKSTGLKIHPKFTRVELRKKEVFNTPLCIFTGQGDFKLSEKEQLNLKRYLQNGGFILASPGCSNSAWNTAFKREIARALPAYQLKQIPMDHEIFSTVTTIKSLTVRGRKTHLQGMFINGRLALVYSPEGLNNAANAVGCCCCGGAEIKECREVNVNAVAYALIH